ncbi:sterol desaturase family protein [Roseobacter sp. HKCCA0434]|uniref:sterol desaturase family protein n=1 Tax=Roseobacter sp. HKCCA0434 TaxID=3079297 RepID=UPI00290597E1|nr:sterol desaturase family protein [Roseobacter sp. HKCCA0434]
MSILVPVLIVLGTVIFMELAAAWIHEHVMHGRLGWGWHRSHHEPTEGHVERNDLYSVVFAGISMAFFVAGSLWWQPLWWIGIGFCVYGVIYYIFHDGLVHQRWPFRYVPKSGYLRRIYQAHRMHHAVEGREGCVSFGFVIVPPVARLRAELRDKQGGALARKRSEP